MDRQPTIDRTESLQSADRQAYQPPELMTWGTLSELTQKVGYKGSNDGGLFPFGYKTSF
jgi:hypothetical protein